MINRWKKFEGDWPVNKKGRTYRQLKNEFDEADNESKIQIIQENTSLIKRPILEKKNKVLCLGYDADLYQSL